MCTRRDFWSKGVGIPHVLECLEFQCVGEAIPEEQPNQTTWSIAILSERDTECLISQNVCAVPLITFPYSCTQVTRFRVWAGYQWHCYQKVYQRVIRAFTVVSPHHCYGSVNFTWTRAKTHLWKAQIYSMKFPSNTVFTENATESSRKKINFQFL